MIATATSDLPLDVEADLAALAELLTASPLPAAAKSEPTEQASLEEIASWLYDAWYCRGQSSRFASTSVPFRTDLVSALRAALPAGEQWDAGWTVLQCSARGVCIAASATATRSLSPGEYVNASRPGMPVAPGDALLVSAALAWLDEPTGFWTARSTSTEPSDRLIRLYWRVGPAHVALVLRQICLALDALEIPYSLKCPARPAQYDRVDSLIVYLERSRWPLAEGALREIAQRASPWLDPYRPPLTRKIAEGLGFAEDPGPADSFGMSRCRALAPGVLALSRDGAQRVDCTSVLAQALATARIDPREPWLCPESTS